MNTDETRPIGAIILAAGSSSRMGRTKQLLKIGGQSLIRRTAQTAIDVGFKPVMVVTGADANAVTSELAGLPMAAVFNSEWQKGIGTSLQRGISELMKEGGEVSAAAILLCDQPGLEAIILRDLISAFRAGAKPIAASEYAGTVGPPCIFDRTIFDELKQIADSDGAKKVLLKDRNRLTLVAWPPGADDLDTPEDWDRFSASKK